MKGHFLITASTGEYTETSTMPDYSDYSETKIAHDIWKYMSPVLLASGVTGNTLSFIVLSKTSMRKTTTSLYLRFLAVFDTMVLFLGLVHSWIYYLTGYYYQDYSEAVCKIQQWSLYSATYISAWLLVFVTLERCFTVWYPHKVKSVCTKRKTFSIIISVIVFLAAINAHYFYGVGEMTGTQGNETYILPCNLINSDYDYFFNSIWSWFDLMIYNLIPSLIFVFCNIAIIYKVVSSNRRMMQNQTTERNNVQSRSHSVRQNQASSLTAMLLTASIAYVVLSTPFCIYIIVNNDYDDDHKSPHDQAIGELVWCLVNMLQYTNNCINFVLYCLSGQRFRREMLALFCRRRRREPEVNFICRTETYTLNAVEIQN